MQKFIRLKHSEKKLILQTNNKNIDFINLYSGVFQAPYVLDSLYNEYAWYLCNSYGYKKHRIYPTFDGFNKMWNYYE